MTITVSIEEAKKMIEDKLSATIPIKKGSIRILEHVEGDYDERINIFEGFQIDLEDEPLFLLPIPVLTGNKGKP